MGKDGDFVHRTGHITRPTGTWDTPALHQTQCGASVGSGSGCRCVFARLTPLSRKGIIDLQTF
jgi:hypothetical protein